MYNPANLNECEKQKQYIQRHWIDRGMTLVGAIASFSSLPQVIQISHSHDISGISLITYLISLGSVLAWLAYGIYIKNKPLIYTTLITSIINSIVIVQILLYG